MDPSQSHPHQPALPRIHCINLSSRSDRRARMERRFARRGVTNFVFVDAVTHLSSLVDYYTPEFEDKHRRCTTACFASHLEALRLFLHTRDEWGVVCEDDVVLHRNFNRLLSVVLRNLPSETTLCMLSYFPIPGGVFPLVRQDGDVAIRSLELCADRVWGGQMYLISRRYVMRCLELYDRSDFGLPRQEMRTSEHITRRSGGLLVDPMLAIEEASDSDIRDAEGMRSHDIFGMFERASCGLGDGMHLFTDYVDEDEETQLPQRVLQLCVQRLIDHRNHKIFAAALTWIDPVWRARDRLPRGSYLEHLLDEIYVAAYYVNRPLAVEVGRYYISCLEQKAFRRSYESRREHIKANFAFVEEVARLLP